MRTPSPARQGPGPISESTVRRLGLKLQRKVTGRLPGEQSTRGASVEGTELSQLRPYVVGDDVRHIDAAATARTGEPHVRLHVPERAVTTWIVVDVSASMAFGTTTRLKSDVAEGAAEAVARVAIRNGGSVGLALAAGPDAPVTPPRGGRTALADLRTQLRAGVVPDGVTGDLGHALRRVGRLARAAGIVVVISDFRDAGWATPLRNLAGRHSVLALEVSDPMEEELPDAGLVTFSDPESGELFDLDTSDRALRRLIAEGERERRAAVATTLRRAHAQHVALRTSDDWLRELGRHLR